jgi:hemerythrin
MERYVEWKPFYSVGDASIDDEHKRLLGMIDEMYQATQLGNDQMRFYGVLEELADYTVVHFDHEERLMRQCGYPDFDAHKTMHEEMRRRALEFRANANSVVARDLLQFLKIWWVRHIQNQDKGYAPYLEAVIRQPVGMK